MHLFTGSQWRFLRTGVMWSCFFVLLKILDARFWILWSGTMVLTGRPLESRRGVTKAWMRSSSGRGTSLSDRSYTGWHLQFCKSFTMFTEHHNPHNYNMVPSSQLPLAKADYQALQNDLIDFISSVHRCEHVVNTWYSLCNLFNKYDLITS
jgi:hypothetical protein